MPKSDTAVRFRINKKKNILKSQKISSPFDSAIICEKYDATV